MTAADLHSVLLSVRAVPAMLDFGTANYSLPARTWLEYTFAEAYRSLLDFTGNNTYVAESNDCNQFADGACWFANTLHNRTRPGKTALAFGTFDYWMDGRDELHRLNIAIVRQRPDIKAYEPIFWEPQQQAIVMLSASEIESAYKCRFP